MTRNRNDRAQLDDLERANSAESSGTITRLFLDKGFGFIKARDAGGAPRVQNVFFHRSTCDGMHFEQLREGDEVKFSESVEGDRGPRAERVWMA